MEEHRIFLAKVHSDQLQAAFERCWNTERSHDGLPDVPLCMPALICASLSAEIGIKALLFAHGIEPGREHNLRNLLDALPIPLRSSIVSDVSERYPDFDAQLSNAENAFVRWRYFYESEGDISVNILFVGALSAAVQRQMELQQIAV